MNNESPRKSLLVVLSVALFCSVPVSVATVVLEPLQQRNALVERSRNIVALSGLVPPGASLSADEVLDAAAQLDARLVDLESGRFVDNVDVDAFDSRAALADPDTSVDVPPELDLARLGRRARLERIYLVWGDDGLQRVILPIRGEGMWSTLYGFVALEDDLNTIGAATFYEQAETAGLGDQITSPAWLALWPGRALFGNDGAFRFRIAEGPVEPDSPAARHQVDGLTGATVTGSAVTALLRYWFGPHGYAPLLSRLEADPPQRQSTDRSDS
jgi:Na+-transporting NADH:ubiquinone oxidoreductase subunit C